MSRRAVCRVCGRLYLKSDGASGFCTPWCWFDRYLGQLGRLPRPRRQ